MIIDCPWCGKRYVSEFSYEGDATIERPHSEALHNQQAWYDYVYARINNNDNHAEIWQHASGCRQFFVVIRNVSTHHIHEVHTVDNWNNHRLSKPHQETLV